MSLRIDSRDTTYTFSLDSKYPLLKVFLLLKRYIWKLYKYSMRTNLEV